MTVVVCAIAKNENKYINDWVNWYLSLGFDKIYLFDNNDASEEFVGNCIKNKDFVKIYNKVGIYEERLQTRCYNEFYSDESNYFDWCLFCDIDEFLWGIDNIKDFLTNDAFKSFEQIRVAWRTFSDSDIIERDISVPVYEDFTNLSENKNLQKQAKYFVRGGLKDAIMGVHLAYRKDEKYNSVALRSCLPSGNVCISEDEGIKEDLSNESVYLNHYRTKSLKEFIDQKLNRGDAVKKNRVIGFDYYWNVNKKTKDKVEYVEKYLRRK